MRGLGFAQVYKQNPGYESETGRFRFLRSQRMYGITVVLRMMDNAMYPISMNLLGDLANVIL